MTSFDDIHARRDPPAPKFSGLHLYVYTVQGATSHEPRYGMDQGLLRGSIGSSSSKYSYSASEPSGLVHEARGWTDLVITPERRIRSADALLTGFHEPRATHLAMLEAIAGRRHLEYAYDAALANGYLWHEFGDVHLIL